MKTMWQYRENIEDLITTFAASTARYRLTCENLLVPLMLPDDEYAGLLNNPNGEMWKRKTLGEDIRQRLGDSHGAYSGLVTRLQKALLKFASKLGLDPDNDMKARSPIVILYERHAEHISPFGKIRAKIWNARSREVLQKVEQIVEERQAWL